MNDLEGIIEDCNKSDLVSKKVIEKIIKIIGQKKWNRIHDEECDVCTTMGELIITLKGIPDLEKEKCELLGIIQGKDKVIKDLEKENEGLKETIRKGTSCGDWNDDVHACQMYLRHEELEEYAYQLTKAKKIICELSKSLFLAKGIIRDLIDDTVDFKESKERAIYCYEQESFDTYKKAEQFLKEDLKWQL